MLVGVVEQDSFALFPVVGFTTHNKRALIFTRNLDSKVHAENARPRTFVRHQHLVRAKHGNVGGNHIFVTVQDLHRHWSKRLIPLKVNPRPLEEEHPPLVVV
jgi:hypothetical protein